MRAVSRVLTRLFRATSNAVLPSSSMACTFTLASSKASTTAALPFAAATCNAVRPLLFLASTSAPLFSNALTTSACPFSAAACNDSPGACRMW